MFILSLVWWFIVAQTSINLLGYVLLTMEYIRECIYYEISVYSILIKNLIDHILFICPFTYILDDLVYRVLTYTLRIK